MCPSTSKINAFHDGELPPDESVRFAEHLLACATCSLELQQLRRLSGALSSFKNATRPGDIAVARWQRAVQRARTGDVLRLVRLVTGIAAAILVGGSLWLFMHPQQSDRAHARVDGDSWEQLAILWTDDDAAGSAETEADDVELMAEWFVDDLETENNGGDRKSVV